MLDSSSSTTAYHLKKWQSSHSFPVNLLIMSLSLLKPLNRPPHTRRRPIIHNNLREPLLGIVPRIRLRRDLLLEERAELIPAEALPLELEDQEPLRRHGALHRRDAGRGRVRYKMRHTLATLKLTGLRSS